MNDLIWVEEAWNEVVNKVKKTSGIIGDKFPSMTKDGKYDYTKDTWRWVTGFWPGLLWLLFEESNYKPFEEIAVSCEKKMDEALDNYVDLHHDVGFMWMLTSVKRYNLTKNEESKRRALIAASHLASRFNIKGNYLVAWNKNDVNNADPRGLSIIDSTMNLPLLFFASEELGDPRFSHIAIQHANTVLKHFVREDGSVNHMVEFDYETGDVITVHSGQGYSIDSAWSRGASWAVHGLSGVYKYTKDQKYLNAAVNVSDYFISQLPEDFVPYWDFRAPGGKDKARDTSAGACAACGLIELSHHVNEQDKEKYLSVANNIVRSIYEKYSNVSNDQDGLISGGTFNHPQGLGINVSLIYGDYYFVEALYRLKQMIKQS